MEFSRIIKVAGVSYNLYSASMMQFGQVSLINRKLLLVYEVFIRGFQWSNGNELDTKKDRIFIWSTKL